MTDWIDGLERLKSLKEQGHLSDSEFELAKRRLLDSDAAKPNQSAAPANEAYSDELISEATNAFSPPPSEVAPTVPKAPRQLGMIPKAVLAALGLVLLGGGGFAMTWYLAGGGKAEAEVAEATHSDNSAEKSENHDQTPSDHPAAPEPTPVPEPEPEPTTDVPPGEYSAYSDGSGNSTFTQIAKLCESTTKLDKTYGAARAMSGFHTEGGAASRIINNGGYSFGKTALDEHGHCRQQFRIQGTDNGNSFNWSGSCRVTTLRVYDDKTVGLVGMDRNDCV
ncbi:SHOCT domain-containing protein [Sphingobium yanoikuyae]|uniref:SHOCT domain-containing protein n=1 Tax=Sphingobium yanoikuyae TaxID=13690 RepID=UPI0028AA1191|nr:SHOCT domain-containing protein [Sphingobium yanoikuyae]